MNRRARPARNTRSQPSASTRGRGGGSGPSDFALPTPIAPALPAARSFAELDMPRPLMDELTRQGVTVPFPIQAATLPNALAGRDVLGRGRTGSGKTLAFGLALLARTAGNRAQPRRPLALVLVPTRELAQQVTHALAPYARRLQLRAATVVGGLSIGRQAADLRSGAEIVVATPGRLKDLIERGDCALDQVGTTVLDEADQMADMGFMPQVTALLRQVPADGQRLLFSATLDRNIDTLVQRFLSDPVVHSVDPSAGAVSSMEHHLLHIADADKQEAVIRIAARDGRVIMFLDTKHAADRLARRLLSSGVRAAALHGGKSQSRRTRTLDQFKRGDVTALIATNVAARGIHVDDLDLVVNVDPPADHKDYLHRGGRTARAGESGRVVTLVLPHQRREMSRIMADAGITPQVAKVRPADAELARITGATAPSGVAVTVAEPAPEQPRETANGGSRRRRPSGRSATASGRSATASGRSSTGSGRGSAASGRSSSGSGRQAGSTSRKTSRRRAA
ncbi:DEAD/DEAH box helicase [Streptomyces sp. NPDC051776]|uniref:DEAD/DEAH box helicase n=1 Tax=Streptomyces sp. NPDC051776 TaxID=3155414 RepID=UPI00344168F2